MLYIHQTKTFSQVIIPLRKQVKGILTKHQLNISITISQKFNLYIKDIARLTGIEEPIKINHRQGNKVVEETKPKYAWVSSHTCRRSFCANEFLAGTPSDSNHDD